MLLYTSDNNRNVNVGTSDIWLCFYSTIIIRLGEKRLWADALEFLRTGKCDWQNGYEIAKQLNLIRDKLSQISPSKIVYDYNHPKEKVPWGNDISPVITSCGNYFTTADGKDFIYELVSILCYAQIKKVSISIIE